MATPTPALPAEIFGVFSDQVNQASVQRIFQSFALATHGDVKHAHVLFQSTGGFVSDGICLHNFFKSLPFELTLYNAGGISSIATIAYIGAKKRKTSASAVFQIHRTSFSSAQPTQASQLEALAEAARIDDERIEAILRTRVKLSEGQWNAWHHRDLVFSGTKAVELGFADEIGDFSPPPGSQIYSI